MLDELEMEDAKKFFYASTLQLKNNEGVEHLVDGMSIKELFKKCMSLNVPRD